VVRKGEKRGIDKILAILLFNKLFENVQQNQLKAKIDSSPSLKEIKSSSSN